MGLILPQMVDVNVTNNRDYYLNKGYKKEIKENKIIGQNYIPIKVHVFDLPNRSHTKVLVQCDQCGKIYEVEYRYVLTNYAQKTIGKMFCFSCSNSALSSHHVFPKNIWGNKQYVLERLDNFIKKYNTLKGWTVNNSEGALIANRINEYGFDICKLCEELGYDYLKLKGLKHPEGYYNDYGNVIKEIKIFIDTYGYFPTQIEMQKELGISSNILQKFGGSQKIKDDFQYKKNEYIDDYGFRNRSHYEYIVSQFLIHNNISFKREQHPFPEPYDNFRSDFTFECADGIIYHLEIWGYSENDLTGNRGIQYNKIKQHKINLYHQYNINLISIEHTLFSNSYATIQEKLKVLLKDIINQKLKTIEHSYLVDPNKETDYELFVKIMKLSKDGFTLPKTTDFNDDDRWVFYEVVKRFGNYNNFAKNFNVSTNSKRNYWSQDTLMQRMFLIKAKYGYMPTTTEIKNKKLSKEDNLFSGIVDAIKIVYHNNIDAYLTFYEECVSCNVILGNKDIEYLQNLYNLKYFRKDIVKEDDRNRAINILNNQQT